MENKTAEIKNGEKLQEAISKYALASVGYESLVAEKEAVMDRIRLSEAYIVREALINELKQTLSATRIEIDQLSFGIFQETQDKNPHPAVQVKEFDDVEELDHGAAVDWCIKNAPNFVTLDNSGLKKYAIGAQAAGAPLPFMNVAKAFKVYLSSKLDEYIV